MLIRYWSAIAIALGFAVATTSGSYAQVSHPPVDAFGQLPEISQASLSPDGKHFAAVQSINGRPAAVIYTVGGGTPPVGIPSTEQIVYRVQWAKNDRLLVSLKTSSRIVWARNPDLVRTYGRTFSVSLDGQDRKMLMESNNFLNANGGVGVEDIALSDRDHIYVSMWDDYYALNHDASTHNQYDLTLYRYDLRTGQADTVMVGDPQTVGWFMDGRGNLVGRLDEDDEPRVDRLKAFRDNKWRDLAVYDAHGDKFARVEGVTADGSAFVRNAVNENATSTLEAIDVNTAAVRTLFANPTYDVDAVQWDEWSGAVTGATYVDDRPRYVFFDPAQQALQQGLEKSFPGLTVTEVSSDLDRSHVIVETEGPRAPPTYYFLDRTTHQATRIGSAYSRLSEADLGEMKPYPYKARDGLEIPAYVTLPPGLPAKNLPMVVMPHGGPDARDAIGFDWWAQFLANRGYVVLQPNYRGSSGYGRKFTEAGFHQWGLKMQDDISDGVKKLIADGIADPKRVCIVGASFGGYAALAGAAFSPDLYACAVSFAGISDLPQVFADTAKRTGKDSREMAFWETRIGDRFGDSQHLEATSPDLHADQVRCPVLLMHGEGDTTVPIEQSELMEAALRKAGKNVRFVRFAGEDHYLNLAETRIRMLSELEAFLAANIGSPR